MEMNTPVRYPDKPTRLFVTFIESDILALLGWSYIGLIVLASSTPISNLACNK